jgi:hypothetical protein
MVVIRGGRGKEKGYRLYFFREGNGQGGGGGGEGRYIQLFSLDTFAT